MKLRERPVALALPAMLLGALGCSQLSHHPELPTPSPPPGQASSDLSGSRTVLETSITLSMRDALEQVEALTPKQLDRTGGRDVKPDVATSRDWRPLREGIATRTWLERGSFEVKLDGASVELSAPVEIAALAKLESPWGRRMVLASCGCTGRAWCGGKPQKRVRGTIRLRAALEVGASYGLGLRTERDVSLEGSCALGPGPDKKPLDLDAELERSMAELLADAERALSSSVTSAPLEQSIQQAHAGLAEPHALAGGSKQLVLQPTELALGPFVAEGSSFTAPLRFSLRPAVLRAEARLPTTRPGLPAPGAEVSGEALRLGADVEFPLATLEQLASKPLVGRRFPNRARRSLVIERVRIYGSEGGVVVVLGIGGDADGAIVLRGSTVVDAEQGEIALRPLRLTPSSTRFLSSLQDVIELPTAQLVRQPWVDVEGLEREVASACRFGLRRSLRSLHSQLEQAARRPFAGGALEARLDEGSILDASIDGRALRARVAFGGELVVTGPGLQLESPRPALAQPPRPPE